MTMGRAPRHSDRVTVLEGAENDRWRFLVRSSRSPRVPTEGCVDVRPGVAATYDGGRVKLPLVVTGAGQRIRIDWIDRVELDATVRDLVGTSQPGYVRFADRASCSHTIGPENTAAIERHLATTAAKAEVPFVTWTAVTDGDVDQTRYDVVLKTTAAD